jgi:hypothetical protein
LHSPHSANDCSCERLRLLHRRGGKPVTRATVPCWGRGLHIQ